MSDQPHTNVEVFKYIETYKFEFFLQTLKGSPTVAKFLVAVSQPRFVRGHQSRRRRFHPYMFYPIFVI